MMDFGRFRFSEDEDVIVVIEEPGVEEEIIKVPNQLDEEDIIVEIVSEIEEDNNSSNDNEIDKNGDNFDNVTNEIIEEPSKTPEVVKVINEDYNNKELMDKYLHGIGEFKVFNFDDVKEEKQEIKEVNLLEKYALDKEVNIEFNNDISVGAVELEDIQIDAIDIEPEVEKTEQEDIQIDAVDIEPEVEVTNQEEVHEKTEPTTINVDAVELEDMTPVELTNDIDAPILPDPASLSEIVENNVNTNLNEEIKETKTKEKEHKKEKATLAKTKTKSTNPYVIFLIVLVLISMGFVGALYVYNSSNKVIIQRTLTHLKEYKKFIGNSFILDDTDELYIDGDVIFTSNSIDHPINNVKVKYNFYEEKEKRAIDFGVYKNNILRLNTKVNFSNQKLYIFLEDIYDKYIQVSNYSYSKDELDMDEVFELFDYASTRLTKNIKKEKYKSENAKILINEEENIVKKTIITLNDKDIAELYNSVIDDIVSDAYYNKILRKLVKEDIKFDLNNIDTTNMNEYIFSIYTDKVLGKIKGIDYQVITRYKNYNCDFDEIDYDECKDYDIEESSSKIQYRVGNTSEFTFFNENEILFKGEIISKDDEITINFKNKKNKDIGYFKKSTKKSLTTYEINIEDYNYKLNTEFKYQIDEVKQNSEYNVDATLKIKTVDETKDVNELSINSIFKVKNKLDKNIDYVAEYINYDDMNSEEFENIIEKIEDIYYDIFEIEEEEYTIDEELFSDKEEIE